MKIYLRPSTVEDGRNIVCWRNSDKTIRHCFSKKKITEESNLKFFNENILTGKYKQFIVERVDEEFGVSSYPIATISLKDFDNENQRCELCVFTSNDEEWNSESQSLAIKAILEKAFSDYGMHKIYSYVFANYADEAHLLIRAGFVVEALLCKEAKDINGNYIDVYRMAITKDEWERNLTNNSL